MTTAPSQFVGEALPATMIVVLTVILLVVAIAFTLLFRLIALYLRATVSGASINFVELIGMKLRRIDASLIVNALIQAKAAGLDVTSTDLQTHFINRGDVMKVISAMIVAKRAELEFTWEEAANLDLAGVDLMNEVRKRADAALAAESTA